MSVNWRPALAGVLAVGAIATLGIATVDNTGATPAAAPAAAKPAVAATPLPVSVMIPAIGVTSKLGDPVTLQPDGTLGVPPEGVLTPSWWSQGPKPGDNGPAVLVGHVDSNGQLGVFHDLDRLSVGGQVMIGRADGSTITFTITQIVTYKKTDLPITTVYGPTADPELRLISCLGSFSKKTGQYLDNIVIFAKAV
jgi:sortase (surface protein transpeptidase)